MNEGEQIKTQNEIREQEGIVARYEMGRAKGAEIDEWEDPSLEVYHVTDHYGFIHQDKNSEEIARLDSKVIETKLNREKKWLAMTKDSPQWEKACKSNKVTERTYKGIPEKIRGVAWCLMLNIKNVKEKNQGVYEKMRDLSKKWSTYVKQIDLDINRTFREHIMFRKRYDIKQQALFNVLCAYSLYDEDVGYCQGMSEVAALLLMFMNEEEAFWCFAVLMTDEKHNMRGFFLPSFPKLIRFKDHHDEVTRKNLKKVKKHLDRNNIHTMSFCIKWFMQCFLDRVPFSLALRFWDIYIWEGEGVLIAVAFTILRLQRERLLKLSEEEILRFFQSDLTEDFGCSDEVVIRTLKLSMNELRQSNKLIPKRPPGTEGFAKKLGSFMPPQTPEAETLMTRAASMNGATANLKSTRVSIPADGGPELGVELLIQENESGWRTVDRFLSQDCFDDLADKSDSSPLFRLRQQADDGLSSCTSLASHDYDNTSFYEGDDDLSAKANKDGRGSPDTLNGSNEVTQLQEDDDINNGEKLMKASYNQSDSRKTANEPSLLTKPNLRLDPESLHLHNKDSIQNALAFYKTIPSGTNYIMKDNPVVPYNSKADHIIPSDPVVSYRMPYSQSSGNVRNASSPATPAIKHFPQYPPNRVVAPSTSSGPHIYSAFRKNISLNSSYLGKKLQHKNVQRDQSTAATKQGVSVVMIGEEKDVIVSNNKYDTIFPNQKTNGQTHPGSDLRRRGFMSVSSTGGSSELLKNPGVSSTATKVQGERNHFHHSTSDLSRESKTHHFVSSKPLLDTGLYHPDYKGVTRIWTGSPVTSIRSSNLAPPPALNKVSNAFSSPSNKSDGKKAPALYTRF